jgi:hypothetical protein
VAIVCRASRAAVVLQGPCPAADNGIMQSRGLRNPILRGAFATLAAATVVWAVLVVMSVPDMLSPSEPPLRLGNFAFGLVVIAVLYALWLLPGCVVVRWITAARGVRGVRSATLIGSLAAAVAFGTIYFFPSLFEWPPTWPQVLQKLPVALKGAAFVLVWFLVFEQLRPRAEAAPGGESTVGPKALPWRRAARTTFETLAIAAVVAYAGILGGISGGAADFFGGEDTYSLVSAVRSPLGTSKAYVVTVFGPGGVLGDHWERVFVLPATEVWSAKHRGLLVWQAEDLEVVDANWESERSLRILVSARDHSKRRKGNSLSQRAGFTVRTVADAAR